MMIFTPGVSFAHTEVVGIEVVRGYRSETGTCAPRLAVDTQRNRHIFFDATAFDVLRQLVAAGVLAEDQGHAMRARLADEAEVFAATGGAHG